jgi:hypothetical protein
MRAILEPIPAAERLEKLHAYEAFLIERDGFADFDAGTLARREIAIARMEASPLRYRGPFDVALFAKQYRRFDPRLATPAEMLLLLVFVKTNANEAYGVEQAEKRPPSGDPLRDRLEQLVLLEERYHTRLLLGASASFGVAISEPIAPTPTTRGIVYGIAELPEAAARPVLLAGEILGIVTFLRLIEAVRRVLAHQPELRDALEERVTEVLIDEIGHMSLNRLLAGTGTFAALRAMLPALAIATRGQLREAEALGVLPISLRDMGAFDVSALPAEVRRRAFVA